MNDPHPGAAQPAAPLPDSLQRFGFRVDPFGRDLEHGFYYASQPLQQRIDLISHLLEFGQQIVVLSGPGSVGKSALLRQVAAAARDSWRLLALRGSTSLSVQTALERLADSYNFELDAGADDGDTSATERQAEQLAERLAIMERAGLLPVCLVDEALALPADTLALLCALASEARREGRLRLLLTADPELGKSGGLRDSAAAQGGVLHTVEVPPLSREQTADYLAARFAAAGRDGELPFSTAQLDDIHSQSAGLPGRITVLARQHLLSDISARSTAMRTALKPDARMLRGVRTALLVIVVGAALVWLARPSPDGGPDGDSGRSEVAIDLPAETVPKPDIRIDNVFSPEPEPDPDPAAQASPGGSPAPAPMEPATLTDTSPIPLPPAPASRTARADTAAEPASAGSPAAATAAPAAAVAANAPEPPDKPPAAQAAPLAGSPPEAAPAPTPKPGPRPVPRDEAGPAPANAPPATAAGGPGEPARDVAWLLKQPGDSYSLQLFGAHNRGAAENFVAAHRRADLWLLTARHQGRPWYVVLYGLYPDRDSARRAIAGLPVRLRQTEPWARPIASLREIAQ